MQEKNKAYTRRDGRRDVKFSIKQLEYEQGPKGWEKHGDTRAISAKKQEPIDVGKGSGDTGPLARPEAPNQTPTPTANHAPAADPFSAIPAEVLDELKPSNLGQNMKVQGCSTYRGHSQQVKDEPNVKAEGGDAASIHDISPHGPDIHSKAEQASTSQIANVQKSKRLKGEVESIVENEIFVKSENSATTTGGPIQGQSPHSKRRKISNTLIHTAQPGQRLQLFSTTIDRTSDVPIVEPKAPITIDLTAESYSSIEDEKLQYASTSLPSGQSNSSSVERVRPTPTQAAERGECSVQ